MQNKVAARIKCSNKGRTSRTEIGWESKEKHSQGEGRPVQGRDRENWNFLDTSETLYVTRTLLHFLRLYKQPPKLTFSSSALAVIFVCPQLTRIQSSPFIPTCVRAQLPSASDSLWPPWTVAHQAPLSMGFSRQEYWSGFPFPTSGDLLDPRVEPVSLVSPALAGRYTTAPPGKPPSTIPTYKVLMTRPALLSLLSSHTGFLRVPSLPTPSCLEPFLCLLPPLQMPFHLMFRGPPPSWDSDSSSEEASSEVPHLTSHSAAPTWCLCVTVLNSLQSNLIFFLSINLLLLKSVQSIFISHFLFLNLRTCSTGKMFTCNPKVNTLSVSTFFPGQAQSSNNVGLTKAHVPS